MRNCCFGRNLSQAGSDGMCVKLFGKNKVVSRTVNGVVDGTVEMVRNV